MSETGNLDVIVFTGPTPRDVHAQFGAVTGTQALPPLFALGYHQCRWNYRDEKDVASVESKFEELDYPYDVLWLVCDLSLCVCFLLLFYDLYYAAAAYLIYN